MDTTPGPQVIRLRSPEELQHFTQQDHILIVDPFHLLSSATSRRLNLDPLRQMFSWADTRELVKSLINDDAACHSFKSAADWLTVCLWLYQRSSNTLEDFSDWLEANNTRPLCDLFSHLRTDREVAVAISQFLSLISDETMDIEGGRTVIAWKLDTLAKIPTPNIETDLEVVQNINAIGVWEPNDIPELPAIYVKALQFVVAHHHRYSV